jgi:hypothetical protein
MAAMRIALRALRVDIAASTRSPLDGTYDTEASTTSGWIHAKWHDEPKNPLL